MSPRRLGLVAIGLLFAAGGAATLARARYVEIAAWRRELAWASCALALVMIVAAVVRRRR